MQWERKLGSELGKTPLAFLRPGVRSHLGLGVSMVGLSIKLLCIHPCVVVIYGARSRLFPWTRKDKPSEPHGWKVRKAGIDPSCNAQYGPKVPPQNGKDTRSIFLSGKVLRGWGRSQSVERP